MIHIDKSTVDYLKRSKNCQFDAAASSVVIVYREGGFSEYKVDSVI